MAAALAIPVATLGAVMGFTGMVSGIFETGLATFKYISGATKTGLDGKRLSEEEAEHRTSTAGRDINRGVVNTLTSVAFFYGSLFLLGLAKGVVGTLNQKPIIQDDKNDRTVKLNSKGVSYPEVVDPRTGKNISIPESNLEIVPKEQRVEWNDLTRGNYIREWYDRGYQTPVGGWENYDIHHIIPRE